MTGTNLKPLSVTTLQYIHAFHSSPWFRAIIATQFPKPHRTALSTNTFHPALLEMFASCITDDAQSDVTSIDDYANPRTSLVLMCNCIRFVIHIREIEMLAFRDESTQKFPRGAPGHTSVAAIYLYFRDNWTGGYADWSPEVDYHFQHWSVLPCIGKMMEIAIAKDEQGHPKLDPKRNMTLQEYFDPQTHFLELKNEDGSLDGLYAEEIQGTQAHLEEIARPGDKMEQAYCKWFKEGKSDIPLIRGVDCIMVQTRDTAPGSISKDDSLETQPQPQTRTPGWERPTVVRVRCSGNSSGSIEISDVDAPSSLLRFWPIISSKHGARDLQVYSILEDQNHIPASAFHTIGLQQPRGIVVLADGSTVGLLFDLDESNRPLSTMASHAPRAEKTKWLGQIRQTIQRLHNMGIVWGGIVEDNVFVDLHGDVKIRDFGHGYPVLECLTKDDRKDSLQPHEDLRQLDRLGKFLKCDVNPWGRAV